MQSQGLARSICISTTLVLVFGILVPTVPACAQTTYRFERLWPTLQQPWYYGGATDVAVDSQRNVYVTAYDNTVTKLSPDGMLLTKWGGPGTAPGEINRAVAIDINEQDEVFVLDGGNARVPVSYTHLTLPTN